MKTELKQNITISQLNELTAKQREYLQKNWTPKYGDQVITKRGLAKANNDMIKFVCDPESLSFITVNATSFVPLFSIGRMIEILYMYGVSPIIEQTANGFSVTHKAATVKLESPELCDALWGAIKKFILEVKR